METLVGRGHGQIVVQELSVLHDHQRIAGVQIGDVRMDERRDGTWVWQWSTGDGGLSWPRYTVLVDRWQQTREYGQRFSQLWIAEIVAMAGHRAEDVGRIARGGEIFALRFEING